MKRNLLFMAGCILIFSGCKSSTSQNSTAHAVPVSSMSQTPVVLPPKVEEPKYMYAGTKFKDPFIPLDGSGRIFKTQGEEETAFDPAALSLKGILIDNQEKMATLIDSSGNNYLIRNKRLFNRKGELVEGVVGIIKLESVVIITQDKTVRELKLRSEEEYQ